MEFQNMTILRKRYSAVLSLVVLIAFAGLVMGLTGVEAGGKKEPKASKVALTKGVIARKVLNDQQTALMEDGVYSCCMKPGCTFCAVAADGCSCAKSLTKGGPVCPECCGGWRAGHGALPGVKADKVQMLPNNTLKTLYDLRARKLKAADKE